MNDEPKQDADRAEPEPKVLGLSPVQVASRAIIGALLVIVAVLVVSVLGRA